MLGTSTGTSTIPIARQVGVLGLALGLGKLSWTSQAFSRPCVVSPATGLTHQHNIGSLCQGKADTGADECLCALCASQGFLARPSADATKDDMTQPLSHYFISSGHNRCEQTGQLPQTKIPHYSQASAPCEPV